MNSNYASWKLLQTDITKHIRDNFGIRSELSSTSINEEAECKIHDALTHEDRNSIVRSFARKTFVGQAIYVRFKMSNLLLTDLDVRNLRLVGEGVKFTATPQAIKFSSNHDFEITLKIVPEEEGEMKLTKIEWDLFEKFRCEVIFNQMESLRDFEKIFKFKVLQQSADLDVSLSLNRDMSLPLIFNESASGRLIIKPSVPIKNVFVICSYSHIFGFQTKALDNLQDLSLDLNLRATKIGDLNIKFLVRYEVADA